MRLQVQAGDVTLPDYEIDNKPTHSAQIPIPSMNSLDWNVPFSTTAGDGRWHSSGGTSEPRPVDNPTTLEDESLYTYIYGDDPLERGLVDSLPTAVPAAGRDRQHQLGGHGRGRGVVHLDAIEVVLWYRPPGKPSTWVPDHSDHDGRRGERPRHPRRCHAGERFRLLRNLLDPQRPAVPHDEQRRLVRHG